MLPEDDEEDLDLSGGAGIGGAAGMEMVRAGGADYLRRQGRAPPGQAKFNRMQELDMMALTSHVRRGRPQGGMNEGNESDESDRGLPQCEVNPSFVN